MSTTKVLRKSVHLKLREEDDKLLKEIAKKFGISESDVVRIALWRYAKELGMDS